MADPIVKVGTHDKGVWDAGNKVSASSAPIAKGMNINDAVAKAKATAGAELIVVDDSGNASVHSLSVKDGFVSKEGKAIDLKELKRDTNKNGYLTMDDNLAGVFKGRAAFVVDTKNSVSYLGARVSQTTAEVELKDAEAFVASPNKNKVDTAYMMASEAGNMKRVEVKLANNTLNDLSANYQNTKAADFSVSLLKPGATKAQMEGLLNNLKSIDSTRNTETTALTGQLNSRTDKYKTELTAPTQRLNKANAAWDTAFKQEEQKVGTAYKNAREAKMPGIYNLEDSVSNAGNDRNNAKGNMDSAIQNRVNAQGRVESLERLPGEIDGLRNRNAQLRTRNDALSIGVVSYIGQAKMEISNAISDKNRLIQDYQRQINTEMNKPAKPANTGTGSVTDDPFSKPAGGGGSVTDDPFSKGTNAKPKTGSVTDDPFSKPSGGNSGSVTDDPFKNSGNYRNNGIIDTWGRQVNDLRSDVSHLQTRANTLDNLAYKLRYSSDLSLVSGYGYNLSETDKAVIYRSVNEFNSNLSEFNSNNNDIREKDSGYRNNINTARNGLASATSNEATARTNYSNAEGRLAQLAGQLDDLKRNPLPETTPKVKATLEVYNKAVANREATIGQNAPLTKEKNTAQSIVNNINGSYNTDKQDLEGKIRNSNDSTSSKAQKMIQDTRAKL